eukprot:CAMPEP_0202712332 /NCGR_PEP_ID=MMETSP1385-20130828/38066_1 /ASSEMBLY_ACC=CAM_ASM_000861 /TAXON_ID=933848 /ORGANISM="Elphidium margaritaceum" /LENGTH=178 /DNA_ID=CAMNT_0049372335 /DNA_START=192 /DNA_END=728 /DNA_ORIENTATION=-
MTVFVIKHQLKDKYLNYLSFWAILALVLGMEYVTFGLFYNLTLYRVARLIFAIYLQVDYSVNAHTVFTFLTPFISQSQEKRIEDVFGKITDKLDEHGGKMKEKASSQFWKIVQQNYELVKETLFKALSSVSKTAVDLTDTNSNASLSQPKVPGEAAGADDAKETESTDNAQPVKKKES